MAPKRVLEEPRQRNHWLLKKCFVLFFTILLDNQPSVESPKIAKKAPENPPKSLPGAIKKNSNF
jgi:hypothetical protein